MYKTTEILSLDKTMAGEQLVKYDYPWQAVADIKKIIISLFPLLDKSEYMFLKKDVWVHKSAVISPTAYIGAPCIIGKNTEIRHSAFIRSSALIGDDCVVGNSTEIKNAILFNGAKAPHFNYVGDSILGYKAHLGAGAITSNVKSDKSEIKIHYKDSSISTALKKLGAVLGDLAEVGCNAVLCPGSVIGKNTTVYPLSTVRGVLDDNCIFKGSNIAFKKESYNG